MKRIFYILALFLISSSANSFGVKGYLETFDLCELEITTSMKGKNGDPYIHIMMPDKLTTTTAVVGDYIGKNVGKIVEITDNDLTIIEIVPDGKGGWKERSSTLQFKRGNITTDCR